MGVCKDFPDLNVFCLKMYVAKNFVSKVYGSKKYVSKMNGSKNLEKCLFNRIALATVIDFKRVVVLVCFTILH